MREKSYGSWKRSYAGYIYRSQRLSLWSSPDLKLVSRPGETLGAFRARLSRRLREQRDRRMEALRRRFAPRLARLHERLERAQERVSRERSQYDQQKMQTVISMGATLLGALFGRKLASSRGVGRVTTTARAATRAARDRQDIARARAEVKRVEEKLASLERDFQDKAQTLRALPQPADLQVEEIALRPRKADITVRDMMLVWTPWRKRPEGHLEPLA